MCYFRGLKHLVRTAGLDKLHQNREVAVLLDWVYYHDVLSRFSLQHWRQGAKRFSGKRCCTLEPANPVLSINLRVDVRSHHRAA